MYEDRARQLFEDHSPYPGQALRNHNLRLMGFCLAIARNESVSVNPDLIRTGCWLHDFGLFLPREGEPSYLKRSWRAVQPHARQWGMAPGEMEELKEMLLFNHGLIRVEGIRPAGDLVRRAVHVEHSLGALREGLDVGTVSDVFRSHPRAGLTRVLVDFARITFVKDGPLQIFPMFFPRPEDRGPDARNA